MRLPGIHSLMIFFLLSQSALAEAFEIQNKALELMDSGQYEEAEKLLTLKDPVSLRLRLELADRRGAVRVANQLANQLVLSYRVGSYETADELSQAAYGAWYLGDWEQANQIFIEASQRDGAALSLFVDWGRLFVEKFNPGEAESIISDAIRAGPKPGSFARWTPADAYVVLAGILRDLSRAGAPEAIKKAESIDPNNLNLLVYRVRHLIKEESWEEASKVLQQGFEINQSYLPLLELDCALALFTKDDAEFARKREIVLDINPNNADLFELLGDLSIPHRRLEDAIGFYTQALERNPKQWTALASRGINYLRLGEEELGTRDLEEAYANDPYNLWTVNTLRLVDSYKRFEVFETPHFKVRLHENEAAALRPYVEELLERSIAHLENRYQHEVDHRVTFEMFRDHEDFAVRTLGMPGLGALGATIGRIVAMDSPSARPRGKFHWGATLWHELAHVVTLSLSKNKVPRWFTEGLSMLEERLGGPGWGDPLTLTFIRYYEEDKLLPINKLNSGFVRPESPEQIAVSYYQAGWLCEFIEDRYGIEKIREMLVAYGNDLKTEEVFNEVLGISPEELDKDFQGILATKLDPYVKRLQRPDEIPKEIDELEIAVKQSPDNYFLNLALGYRYLRQEQYENAVPVLEHAIELFPWNAGDESPYAFLSRAYQRLDDQDNLENLLDRWWSKSPMMVENARILAELKKERSNDYETAINLLEDSMFVNPLETENHRLLGNLYIQRGLPDKAVREFEVLLALDPVDKASAHFQLAQALSKSGHLERARHQVLMSLEIAPGFMDAQKLLLDLVRQ